MPRKPKQHEQPFNRILNQIMKERGLKLVDIARMAGISVSVAGDWSAGAMPSDMMRVQLLCDALGVSMRFMLTGTHETNAKRAAPSIAEVLSEAEKVEGIFKISLQRLVPISIEQSKKPPEPKE